MAFVRNSAIAEVPKTGVIYVMTRAYKHGFSHGDPDWANLGQGAPETGKLPDSTNRIDQISLTEQVLEYSPVSGIQELKEAVADLYNYRYRQDKQSKYSAKNVAISPGGRSGLVRIAAALGSVNLGHFLPDYTAYEELLDLFNRFVSIPVINSQKKGFKPQINEIEKAIVNMGLGALLLSNPCNPTGQLLNHDKLRRLVNQSQKYDCTLILDEFYSHYLLNHADYGQKSLSAASAVNDVNEDNVILIDGLTKNWRYPGLRISWTLAPEDIIECIASSGSFLDGGASHSTQKAIIPFLKPEVADREAEAIQSSFKAKQCYMLERLKQMGFVFHKEPEGSFYCFPSLENLPEPLQDGMRFFEILLQEKVICVPGIFFDVNPGQRRKHDCARLNRYVRFSFGPPMAEIERGLNRIETVIQRYC